MSASLEIQDVCYGKECYGRAGKKLENTRLPANGSRAFPDYRRITSGVFSESELAVNLIRC